MEIPLDKVLSSGTWGAICSLLMLAIIFLALYIRSIHGRLERQAEKHAEALAAVYESKEKVGLEHLQMLAELSTDSIAHLKDVDATLEALKSLIERWDNRKQ